jgi:hypothetical protein
MTDLAAIVTALLLELDRYPGGPAAALRVLGCRGVRFDFRRCPVARYIRHHLQHLQHVTAVDVRDSEVIITGEGVLAVVPLPPRVTEFTRDLDFGKHPDLEAA